VPALGAQPLAIDTRPVERHPLFLENLRDDDVAIVDDADLDRDVFREDNASHVSRAAPQTPHDTRARLDGVVSHVLLFVNCGESARVYVRCRLGRKLDGLTIARYHGRPILPLQAIDVAVTG
jgi:hypothetical protein